MRPVLCLLVLLVVAAVPAAAQPRPDSLPELPGRADVAAACRGIGPGIRECGDGVGGTLILTAHFDSSGQVTRVEVEPRWADTDVGRCAARVASTMHLPPFRRASFSVRFPFSLERAVHPFASTIGPQTPPPETRVAGVSTLDALMGATRASVEPELPPRSAVVAAMRQVAPAVEACVAEPGGTLIASVTLVASGHVAAVIVWPPYAGTPAGRCAERAIATAVVRPFRRRTFRFEYPYRLR